MISDFCLISMNNKINPNFIHHTIFGDNQKQSSKQFDINLIDRTEN